MAAPAVARFCWWEYSPGDAAPLYQAVARHIYGKAEAWTSVRDELLCKYTYALLHEEHPYHERCLEIEENYTQKPEAVPAQDVLPQHNSSQADASLHGLIQATPTQATPTQATPAKASPTQVTPKQAPTQNVTAQSVTARRPRLRPVIIRGEPIPELLEILADALDLQLHLDDDTNPTIVGSPDAREIHLKIAGANSSAIGESGQSVSVRGEDGARQAFCEYLQRRRELPSAEQGPLAPLNMRKLTFGWRSYLEYERATLNKVRRKSSKFICANEYDINAVDIVTLQEQVAALPIPEDDVKYRISEVSDETHQVYTVCVPDPEQVRPAVDFMLEALGEASGQGGSFLYSQDGQARRRLKPYVAVDCEFIKRSSGVSHTSKHHPSTYKEYVSILTVAVDEHLVFMFYLLDMLDKPNGSTVDAIYYLLKHVIFDDSLLKLWHNLQQDIRVLENTIQLMYQGSVPVPRMGYTESSMPLRYLSYLVRHLDAPPNKDSIYFQGERPADIMFPTQEASCQMHRWHPQAACPCTATANLDLEAILNHVTMSLRGHVETTGRYWFDARKYYSWHKLVEAFLNGDILEGLLHHCKDAVNMVDGCWGDLFYQSFGPGIENDSYKMAYNIGDVIGIIIMFKFLIQCSNPELLAMRLHQQQTISEGRMWYYLDEVERLCAGLPTCQMELPHRYRDYEQNKRRVDAILDWGGIRVWGRGRGIYKTPAEAAEASERAAQASERASCIVRTQRLPRAGYLGQAISTAADVPDPVPHIATVFSHCIRPRSSETDYARPTSGLTFREHDQRVTAILASIAKLSATNPFEQRKTFPKTSDYPDWSKGETEWQACVAEEAHVRSFDATNFRLPTACLRIRHDGGHSPLAQLPVAPAAVKHLEDLECLDKQFTRSLRSQDAVQIRSAPDLRPAVDLDRSVLHYGLVRPEWARLPICPALPTSMMKVRYLAPSSLRSQRMAWLKACLKIVLQGEDILNGEHTNIVDGENRLLGIINPYDVFDREGREYRRRVRYASSWQHAGHIFPAHYTSETSQVLDRLYAGLKRFVIQEKAMEAAFDLQIRAMLITMMAGSVSDVQKIIDNIQKGEHSPV